MDQNDLTKLQAYLQEAYPDRRDLHVSDLVSLSVGWESDVYGFRAAWNSQGEPHDEALVLRVYPGVDAVWKSAREFEAMQMLYRAGYPVPRVDLLEREQSPFGKPFMIMQRAAGSGMWERLFHSAADNQHHLMDLFCGLFARLHAVEWRKYLPDSAERGADESHNSVERTLSRWMPHLNNLPIPGFHANFQWLEEHQHLVQPGPAVPAHWDFHPENVLLDNDGDAVVIDWTSFELTDYRFDLAWTLLLIGSHEGMQWREVILRNYERLSGRKVEGLEYFDAACALRRLFSVVASVIYGPEKLGMRPGAQDIMRRQAPALRKVYNLLQERTGLPIVEVEQFLEEADPQPQ